MPNRSQNPPHQCEHRKPQCLILLMCRVHQRHKHRILRHLRQRTQPLMIKDCTLKDFFKWRNLTFYYSDSTSTALPVPIPSGNVGNPSGRETTLEASTTIVISGVFTTSLKTVLPNGQTSGVVTTTTGIHTITTTTAVPTQIGTVRFVQYSLEPRSLL